MLWAWELVEQVEVLGDMGVVKKVAAAVSPECDEGLDQCSSSRKKQLW